MNSFLSRFYNAVGLKILNDAAKNVPAVRYAGAVLIFAILGAAGLYLFQGDLASFIGVVLSFVVIAVLLIVLGAASSQGNKGKAEVFSWVIVISISMAVLVITSSILFQLPRPIGEILHPGETTLSLDDVSIELERDAMGNLVLTTKGMPRQPYALDVDFVNPVSNENVGKLNLPVPSPGDAKDPSGLVKLNKELDHVNCVLNLKSGKKSISSKTIPVTVSKST